MEKGARGKGGKLVRSKVVREGTQRKEGFFHLSRLIPYV